MEENFDYHLSGFWLVFGGSFLNHSNAPVNNPDHREQVLVDALSSFLEQELESVSADQLYDPFTLKQLAVVQKLLNVWSSDLDCIYNIREGYPDSSRVRRLARRFLERIQNLKNVCIIPNGLISSLRTGPGHSENVCAAILLNQGGRFDWVQVDPGSAYHQHCEHVVGGDHIVAEESNAYLTIQGVNPANITEDLMYLLVSLKAVHPGGAQFYEDLSLYECLLSHLNGRTTFQSQRDEGFIVSSQASPIHTWQVIDKSFCYLLQHLLGDGYLMLYQRLVLNFKFYLVEKTLSAYQSRASEQLSACRFLLQEMCREVAQKALDNGSEEQKEFSFQLINSVKAAIEERWSEEVQEDCQNSQLNEPHVLALDFVAPRLMDHTPSSEIDASSNLKVNPVYIRPTEGEDVVNYLQNLKVKFFSKLIDVTNIDGIALLSFGIETFLIDYLAQTSILNESSEPFSKNDSYLANNLYWLAEIYCGCQTKLVKVFLSNMTYQPQYYAKNVTVQFFVYAAIAALNLRDPAIGPTLADYNLCVGIDESVLLDRTIPQLVLEGALWAKVLLDVQAFFIPKKGAKTLFAASQFSFRLRDSDDVHFTDVIFALKLLEEDPLSHQRFTERYDDPAKNTRASHKWANLAYTEIYLPSLYFTLSKAANLAKYSLLGFPPMRPCLERSNCIKTEWMISPRNFEYGYANPIVRFRINNYLISNKTDPETHTNYVIHSSPYQRFITRKCENRIIATQDAKPETMGCNRYMQLGFLQSEPQIKLERLYIALKDKQLDFSCKEETVLIKQTLFEIGALTNINGKNNSLLEWTSRDNPALIHEFGLLCIEKALAMQYRLTQHHAIGEILSVTLGLLTFCPDVFKESFTAGIIDIYHLLKGILEQPPAHLSDNTLLHLNAYLLIAVQAKPQLLENDLLTVLQALVAIQNFKVKGSSLDNIWLLRVRTASYTWCPWVENQLQQDRTKFNDLMLTVIPQWDQQSVWQKNKDGLLFTCMDYAIEPLLGSIYFKNQQVMGLPDQIMRDRTFKECLGNVSFPVIPSSCEIKDQQVACYLSVDRSPQLRLMSIHSSLLIEEWVETDFQRYVPSDELLGHSFYSRLLYEKPHNKEKLQHWLDLNAGYILIKDKERNVLFKWDLGTNFLFSSKHNGYVIPWQQLQDSFFKQWLERLESYTWIELIAKPTSYLSDVDIQSLNFPRLGLHFDFEDGLFYSKQVHNYVIAQQQHLNTLHGFSNYLVLEFKEQNSVRERIKVIIPYRKVTPEKGSFYVKKAWISSFEVRSPAYFVYDYDRKMGLLKGHHIRAYLYLALLYFRTASLDDHDESHCNPYHLACENLDLCWKDEPYDNVELEIIEQLLDVSAMQCLHSNLIALFLKVVSLLNSSLRLAFLLTDKTSQQNKEKSMLLLQNCARQCPDLFSIYFQHKKTIFERIKLSIEEEKAALKHCPVSFIPIDKICYNKHYREFFVKQALISTNFVQTFHDHLANLHISYDKSEINFLSGIHGVLTVRFRLQNFFTLYKLAKASSVTLEKYCYLLHHLLLRIEDKFWGNMFARALLLVAENPARFPNCPTWLDESITMNMTKRQLIKANLFSNFPFFHWTPLRDASDEENENAKREAKRKDDDENEQIWSLLARYDLDSQRLPRGLPEDIDEFTLQYEKYIRFSEKQKRNHVRNAYLQAAYNDALYQFFFCVFDQCDDLKYDSRMGLDVMPFLHKTITVPLNASNEMVFLPTPEPVSLVKWAVAPQPLIDLNEFFACNSQPAENNDFLFESQLSETETGYQHQFYSELKASWLTYTNEQKCSYSWLNIDSVNELAFMLQEQYTELHNRAKEIWSHIESQFKQRSNNGSNDYFALRWYSGQVRHYHKRDILRLLIEPHKLPNYNPDCLQNGDNIIQEVLKYINYEITSAKIVRVLGLIGQYKQAQTSPEQFSVLQSLVRSLQENVDPESYRYPHWFLFQYENEIIVRENQRELIVAMLGQSGKATYQLNMGEGKTSVILPLLSYNLANGKQLLRINVLSPLCTTMKEFLRQCFSGLIQKKVYSLPFNRDTNISNENLKLIYETLQTCQDHQQFLLVTPEHRMCIQLKIRELVLENQQQIGATNIFNWVTYRQRTHGKPELYQDLDEEEMKNMLLDQDEALGSCLRKHGYIDKDNRICKIPPREHGYEKFAQFKEIKNNSKFREWSCLKAAYCELLYNSTLAQQDCRKKLALLNKIGALTAIDLLDESDEILKHGTELNYTMGDRHVFAGGELRWKIPQFFIEAIFCDPDVRDVITAGKAGGFTAINPHYSSQGGVPFIQLLNESYFDEHIKPLLINKFFDYILRTLRKYHCSVDSSLIKGESSSLRMYVAGQLPLNTEKKMISILSDKGSLKDKILIAKGWLSHGVLFHVFNAKYRVQYGLNVNAQGQVLKPIAIPFFGKDAPSQRSEFSHPDVMLGFTTISYLYQGLNQMQLKETINKLKSEFCEQVANDHLADWKNASRRWIEFRNEEFPPFLLTSLQHVDVADEQCLNKVHEYLSGNYLTIFFYLNQFVLLEEAMQYLFKISANAHSLVGYDAALGFSGTDDKKITMPFQVKSLRSLTQEGTNGKLLSVLTQERNRDYYSLQSEDTVNLLKKLCSYASTQRNCHALIDAGALITGLSNFGVAKFLLSHLPSNFLGIVYFSDEKNNLTVLTRDKKILELHDCYLDKECLFVYLDDIHTRGTDLKLPLNSHAILTIGMGMQKDKLMQAAMRLRQLAEKQSVSLWGTQAVTLAIARDNSVAVASINSLEVIKWVTRNTLDNINADLFHVAVRKINFQFLKRAEAWLKETSTASLSTLVQCCQEKELFELEDFYALSPQCEDLAFRLNMMFATRLRTFWQGLQQDLQNKQSSGAVLQRPIFTESDKNTLWDVLFVIVNEVRPYLRMGYVQDSLDNDEEKEVEVEIVQEQQVVNRVIFREEYEEISWHARLILQDDFLTSALNRKILMPLRRIKYFIQTPADLKHVFWHDDVYMTFNFINSVVPKPNEKLDNYLRPVDVVLMHRFEDKSTVVLLSGKEAAKIKLACYRVLDSNLLIHINDINGSTQLPVGSHVSEKEQKLLSIVKLFAGECHYTSMKEVRRLAKRVGRIYPLYFKCLGLSNACSEELFGILIDEGYLDFAGVMTEKLLKILRRIESESLLSLNLPAEYLAYNELLLEKLHRIFMKLIISPSIPLKDSHSILSQWVETRGRLKEYSGSALESVLDSENELKCSQ